MTEIKGYTLAQFAALSKAASRAERQRRRDEAINMRASQYEQGDWARYLKELERDE